MVAMPLRGILGVSRRCNNAMAKNAQTLLSILANAHRLKRLSKGRIPDSGPLDQLLEESLADIQKFLAGPTARTSKRTTAQ
jgi:hypothetical protein